MCAHERIDKPASAAAGERARHSGLPTGGDRTPIRAPRTRLGAEQEGRADLDGGCAYGKRCEHTLAVCDPAGSDQRNGFLRCDRFDEFEQRYVAIVAVLPRATVAARLRPLDDERVRPG